MAILAMGSDLPEDILALADLMATRPNGFRVSPRTAPLIVRALRAYAERSAPIVGGYTVEVWSADTNRSVETLATAAVYAVARAAYAAAVTSRPGAPVSLRQGIRVIEATFRDG